MHIYVLYTDLNTPVIFYIKKYKIKKNYTNSPKLICLCETSHSTNHL